MAPALHLALRFAAALPIQKKKKDNRKILFKLQDKMRIEDASGSVRLTLPVRVST